MPHSTTDYTCPSAQPDTPEARVIGVVLGDRDQPRVSYLEKGVAISPEMIASLDGVSPTRVFRFAGTCAGSGCGQFKDGGCRLGKDVLGMMTPVTDRVPACTIRATCRWFAENGAKVCLRCERVVTTVHESDTTLAPVAAVEGQQRVSLV